VSAHGLGAFIGGLIALVAVAAWAFYTVESRRLVAGLHPLSVLALSTLLSTPFNLLLAAPFIPASIPGLRDPLVDTLILYTAVAPGFVAYLAWIHAVKLLGASSTNIYVNLLPLAALLLSVTLLHETLDTLQWLGAVLILASAGLTGWREARRGVAR
jgi:drug/metabolite transporter (DMT)-like permease